MAATPLACGGKAFDEANDGSGGDDGLRDGGIGGDGGSSAGGSPSTGGASGPGASPGSGGVVGAGGVVGTGGLTGPGGSSGAGGVTGGLTCGDTFCPLGQRCCDPACGLCAPLGAECPPDCGVVTSCGMWTCPSGWTCCDPTCGCCAADPAGCSHVTCGPPDGGKPPERCGRTFCSPDETCCEGCGVCVNNPMTCAVIDCAPQCSPMDAQGMGPCFLFFGYRWTGSGCDSVAGCSCAGADCDLLFPDPESCLAAHLFCPIPLE